MAAIFKPGVTPGGSPIPSRPTSRANNRSTDDGGRVKRTDSNKSMLDSGSAEQKAAKNNIKVAVRIRPLSDKERGRGDQTSWGTDGTGGVGLYNPRNPGQLNIKYAYDQVFDMATTNQQVFEQVGRPTIEPVVQGVSGTVFAYGVTSSGKTHTMMGTAADPGLVPRAIAVLFDLINDTTDRVFTVTFSMMEIYCEMLNDLLDPTKLNLDVQERELPNGRGAVLQVKNLTEGKVASAEAAVALIQQGQDNRKVGATAYNDQSSRSHTLCRFLVESCPANTTGSSTATTRTSAWLTLVDLAGSEGAKAALSKDQQAEARDINRSLLTLGKVVFELAKGSQGGHVPFRDSLLTRLLKPSLTGNGAKVAIICNVTPASSQSEETWNTLRFADGAKRIKVNAVKNEALDVAAVVAQYQREVEALKAQLAALTGAAAAGGGALSPAVLQAMQTTWANSSSANAADQLADQEAQLGYLQECNAIVSAERDQLLSINRKMMALLAEQVRGILASSSSGSSSSSAEAAVGVASTVRHRRCLSFESLQYYSSWNHEQGCKQQQQQDNSDLGSLGASSLIRLSDDSTSAGLLTDPDTADALPAVQAAQNIGFTIGQALLESQTSSAVPCSSRPGSKHQLLPLRPGGVPAVLPNVGPVVPCSIYFPGNRRTSKTLALAVPGVSAVPAEGATAATWLGPVATASAAAAAAAGCSAVSEAVEAHRRLTAAQERLDLLVQQLDDKEKLLQEARQMQEGQTLQLRLTITAADRALLRDKLAEAEQQLASYQAVLKDYEAEKEELYDTAYSLYSKVQKLTEQNHAAATEMQQLKSRMSACFHAGSSGSAASAATAGAASAGAVSNIGGGFMSPRKAMLATPPVDTTTVPATGSATNGSNVTFVRPKSAAAAYGPRPVSAFASSAIGSAAAAAAGTGSVLATGSMSASVTPRYGFNSSMHSRSNSIGNGSSGSNLAAAAAAALKSSQSAALGDFNPICINSPFGAKGEAAATAAAVTPRRGSLTAASAADGSPTASNRNSASGSSNNNSNQSVNLSTGRASPTPISSALNTGASRIPMPPCLQQRPKQLAADNVLMKLGMLQQHSKLPSVPSSGYSSGAASAGGCSSIGGSPHASAVSGIGAGTSSTGFASGGRSPSPGASPGSLSNLNPAAKPPLGAAMSGISSCIPSGIPSGSPTHRSVHSMQHSRNASGDLGLGCSLNPTGPGSLVASTAGSFTVQQSDRSSSSSSKKQALISAGSPLVAPINRLKSQPGLLAVAAAAVRECSNDGSGPARESGDGSDRVLAAGVADGARLVVSSGAEDTAAATAEDLQELWAALPQTQATARKLDVVQQKNSST